MPARIDIFAGFNIHCMHPTTESKTVMYNYTKDGRVCSTPNVEIAVSRRDADTEIQVETIIGDKKEFSVLSFN